MAVGTGTSTGKRNSNLRPPWKPGEGGNPKGSSRKLRMQAAINRLLDKCGDDGTPTEESMALGVMRQAVKGNVQAFEAITNRIDGKVADKLDLRMPQPIMLPRNERDNGKTKRRGNGNGRKKANGKNRVAS